MEIEISDVKPKPETEEERKKLLYRVGNIITDESRSFLMMIVSNNVDGGGYSVVNLKTGDNISLYDTQNTTSLKALADEYYEPTDRLVTKLTAEVEEV